MPGTQEQKGSFIEEAFLSGSEGLCLSELKGTRERSGEWLVKQRGRRKRRATLPSKAPGSAGVQLESQMPKGVKSWAQLEKVVRGPCAMWGSLRQDPGWGSSVTSYKQLLGIAKSSLQQQGPLRQHLQSRHWPCASVPHLGSTMLSKDSCRRAA